MWKINKSPIKYSIIVSCNLKYPLTTRVSQTTLDLILIYIEYLEFKNNFYWVGSTYPIFRNIIIKKKKKKGNVKERYYICLFCLDRQN